MLGAAVFSHQDDGLLFEERGEMSLGSYTGTSIRRYAFSFDAAGAATVHFEDGRLFHQLDLSSGAARVRHDCEPDLYEGRYRALGPACWTLAWRVTGPRKQLRIASRFERPNEGQGRCGF